MDFIWIIATFFLGGTIGWWLSRSQSAIEIATLHARLQDKDQFFDKTLNSLEERFKGLSSEILSDNATSFLQLANENFEKFQERARHEFDKKAEKTSELLKPVSDSLQKFEGKIKELEEARLTAYVSLKEQVLALVDVQKHLRIETGNLVKALRMPHVRGKWGEIQLKRVVELAGMVNHCDFVEQQSVGLEAARLRPDMIIKLPGGRNIVVDAKAPLAAYLDAQEAESEDLRKIKMQEHAAQVRTHMTQLGKKGYWEQFQPTPEFVVLFLPAETFFSAALEYDPTLIEGGVEERVILATPTTLIALLKSVAYGWRQESVAQNAEQVSALGRELYKRVGDLNTHWNKLGKSLEGAVSAYNKATGTLASRVLVTARKFKELEAAGAQKELEEVEQVEVTPRQLERLEQ